MKALVKTGQLVASELYDMDFNHQFIETGKYDAKMTYKKFTGYSPSVAAIGDLIVGIESRGSNVRFHQQDTLERIFLNLETNDYTSTEREIMKFYNLRDGEERIFDDINNGFGWARLPKSFMAENTRRLVLTTVFLLLTALIRNFYKFIMDGFEAKAFQLKKTSRIKTFVFRFVSVPAKWIRTARRHELNIYTDNLSYKEPFSLADG